jgi:thiosulfate/3-mercaptopyruvate sulfurtransferase
MSAQDVLVSTDWVAQHANDPGIKLVEVDVDTNAYDEGHIAGAVGFNWTSQLQDQVRRDVISKADLESLLSNAGIANDDTIILYGDNNNWFAAYAYWVLEMYGHRNLKLMDGGRKKWLDEGKPTTKEAPKAGKTAYKAAEPNLNLRARQRQVEEALGKSALVDVRSAAEFSGETTSGYMMRSGRRVFTYPRGTYTPVISDGRPPVTGSAESLVQPLARASRIRVERSATRPQETPLAF